MRMKIYSSIHKILVTNTVSRNRITYDKQQCSNVAQLIKNIQISNHILS